jgi:Protein of unknown function (DUF3618)
MTSDPDQIRSDIESTRASLSEDVDRLTQKISPRRVAQRTTGRLRDNFHRTRDKVMGTAEPGPSQPSRGLGAARDKTTSAVSSATDTATSAPDMVRERTEGNPLAAGMIAFGIGWLASSLLPATKAEKRAGSRLQSDATELGRTVGEEAKQAAQDVLEDMKQPTRDAAESVKSTAQHAASEVKDHADEAATDVRQQAQNSSRTMRRESDL